ncbi:MAG: ATPase domain-containing protein, partial [Candidatus Korarchaeum sp.]
MAVERLSTGVKELDSLLQGGIPRGFLVAVAGEPGTGKTVLCLHFIWQGVIEGDKAIYVTTEESRDSLVRQAEVLGMGMGEALEE